MILGLWSIMLMDLQIGLELREGEDWYAVRLVFVSPLLGFGVKGDWVAAAWVTP